MSLVARAEKAFAEARPGGGAPHYIHDPGPEPRLSALVITESGPCTSCGKPCRGTPDRGGRFWHTSCVTLAKSSPF